jgi:hypothetical protein
MLLIDSVHTVIYLVDIIAKIAVRKMSVQWRLCMLLCVGFAAARDLLVIEFLTPGNTVNASYVMIDAWM